MSPARGGLTADRGRSRSPGGGWYVYILRCTGGRLYTGMTNDVERRFREHRAGKGGRFTRAFGAVEIVHTEEHPTRSAALKREALIKRWSKRRKLSLLADARKTTGQ